MGSHLILERSSICFSNTFSFPLLVLKGLVHYWIVFCFFFRGLKHMEEVGSLLRGNSRNPQVDLQRGVFR